MPNKLTPQQRLDTSTPETTQREIARFAGTAEEMFEGLAGQYAPRWKVTQRVTNSTTRPQLKRGELTLVDSANGSVRLYLPRMTPKEAGLACGFIKRSVSNAVHLQCAGSGVLINGLTALENLTQIGFHYVMWDGTAWWVREPRARVQPHSTSYSPLGLWQFSATTTGGGTGLTDSSGNGYDLTLENGTQRYAHITQTMQGLYLDGLSNVLLNSAEANFRITGDLTAEMIFLHLAPAVNNTYWFSHEANGELEADNILYGLGYFGAAPTVGWFQESGVGVDRTATPANIGPTPGVLCHWAVTRTSDVVRIYNNGHQWGSASATLTTATGGTNGRFRIGGLAASGRIIGVVSSFKLLTRALTETEIRGEYNYTMGGAFGYL